ncbi:hypothetical protein Hanom_Chr06g00548821 [Helianthus anomalus]
MDPLNNPNNPNNPTQPNIPNVFLVPGYYPMIEPNQFSQYSSNAFAAFQHSSNVFAQPQQSQALQQLMMRCAFNLQPEPNPTQPERSEPDEDVEVVPEKRQTSGG